MLLHLRRAPKPSLTVFDIFLDVDHDPNGDYLKNGAGDQDTAAPDGHEAGVMAEQSHQEQHHRDRAQHRRNYLHRREEFNCKRK